MEELKKLNLWLNLNRLSLNVSKTNFIIFHLYNKPLKHHITLKINKKAINEKDHIKFYKFCSRCHTTDSIPPTCQSQKLHEHCHIVYISVVKPSSAMTYLY